MKAWCAVTVTETSNTMTTGRDGTRHENALHLFSEQNRCSEPFLSSSDCSLWMIFTPASTMTFVESGHFPTNLAAFFLHLGQ